MRKIWLVFAAFIFTTAFLSAQTRLSGYVKIAESETPLPGVTVTLLHQNISTKTNAQGEFNFSYLTAGDEEVSFSKSGYLPQIKLISL